MKQHSKIGLAVAIACAGLSYQPAYAQSSDSLILQEIIVTAEKREQTLQETPISVSVVTAETIQLSHIQDIIDLQSIIPSLTASQAQSTTNTTFVIRGFGNGENNLGIEPSVGVFIDGVYRSRAAAAINDLPSLDRVEVLSGPQSTLFGKNASAGVINIVTPVPSGETSGYVSGSLGNYNALVLKGLVESSLSDTVSFDVSGSYQSRDGYFINEELDEDLNDRDRFSVRGQLYYAPSENSSWRILVDHSEIDEACCDVVNVVSGQSTALIGAVGGRLVPDDPEANRAFYDKESSNLVENSGVSLQIEHDFYGVEFTSITALRKNESFSSVDLDFTSAALFNANLAESEVDTFTQEIRFRSSIGERVDWLLGGFYFDESIEGSEEVIFGPAFRPFTQTGLLAAGFPFTLDQVEQLIGVPTGAFYQAGTGTSEQFSLDNESFSVFGQVDIDLTDRLSATLGLNYTKDEKKFSVVQTLTELRNQLALPPGLDVIPAVVQNTIDIPNAIESNTTDDDELTYTTRLALAATENVNFYLTHATGFKASSINLQRDSSPTVADFARLQAAGLVEANSLPGSRFAKPENATITEIGMKALLARGAINVAIFDQQIEDFQALLFNGTALNLVNAGQQSVTGVDFDISYLPIDPLLLRFKGTILDPVYDDFVSVIGGDLSGQQVQDISEVSLSLSAQYDFNLAGLDFYVRGDYQYVKEAPLIEGFSTDIASSKISMLNMSAGFQTAGGYLFTLWGRNLTDDAFLWDLFPSVGQPGNFSGFRNQPRTYGVTVRKNF